MAEMKDYTKIMPISAYVPKTPKMSAANENFIQGQDRDGNFYFTGEMTGITFRIGDKVELGPKIYWGDNKKDNLIIHQFFTTDRYLVAILLSIFLLTISLITSFSPILFNLSIDTIAS